MHPEGLGLRHEGYQRASGATDKEDERGLVPTKEVVVVQNQHRVAVSGSAIEVKVLFGRLEIITLA